MSLRWFSQIARVLANHKTAGYNAAVKLVPLEKKVCLVENGVATKGVLLDSLEVPKTHQIKVLNVRPIPENDPEVVVQITENTSEPKKKLKKVIKKPQIKNVQISWGISESDLARQKLGAIESILSRGHIVEVNFQKKSRREPPPNPNQLEYREKLIVRVEESLQKLGSQVKPPIGNTGTAMTFVYGPKAQPASQQPSE